jgi:hypothetical protein
MEFPVSVKVDSVCRSGLRAASACIFIVASTSEVLAASLKCRSFRMRGNAILLQKSSGYQPSFATFTIALCQHHDGRSPVLKAAEGRGLPHMSILMIFPFFDMGKCSGYQVFFIRPRR